jgi:hypothetical protein
MTDLVIKNSDNADMLAQEIRRFIIDESERASRGATGAGSAEAGWSETGRLTFSEVAQFSVAALLLQEWMVQVRTVLNSKESDRRIPGLEGGRLQKWVEEQGRDRFGHIGEFTTFTEAYGGLVEQHQRLARLHAAGEREEAERLYYQMVENLKRAKEGLHSVRHILSEQLEREAGTGDDPEAADELESVEEESR